MLLNRQPAGQGREIAARRDGPLPLFAAPVGAETLHGVLFTEFDVQKGRGHAATGPREGVFRGTILRAWWET